MRQHPPRSVALHIGVHKTATTHLQRSMGAQQQALIDAGIRYYGPENLRRPKKGLGDIFDLDIYGKPPRPTRSRAEQTDFMFKDGHRLILSDENYIGVLHDQSGNIVTPLYPKASERIGALAQAIDAGPMDIFLSFRNPASFLTSAYGQALLGGTPITFSDYIGRNTLDRIYWPGLVARVRETQGVDRIFVWPFEDYRWRFYDITGAMMGDHVDMRIVPMPDKIHTGLSEAAVAQILSQPHVPDLRDAAAAARAAYPVSDAYPAFDPFSAADKVAAAVDYADQMAAIERIAGVTILRP